MRTYLLPVAIVLTAVVLAIAFRYAPTDAGTFDRWTGCYYFEPYRLPDSDPRSTRIGESGRFCPER